jgi:hypothetical protein
MTANAPVANVRQPANHHEMNQLIFRYQFDASFEDRKRTQDDFGRLSLSAKTDRFSGNSGFWVQWQDVKEFGEALAAFPITSPISAQWGYDMQEGNDLILKVEIAPADPRGTLMVRFEIADEFDAGERVRGSFTTHYPELEAFRLSIAKMMNLEIGEAVLMGSN